MKRIRIVVLLAVVCAACAPKEKEGFPKSFSVQVSNPLPESRTNSMAFLSIDEITQKANDFNPKAFVVYDNDIEIPSQFIGSEKDNQGIASVIAALDASETRSLIVYYNPMGEANRNYPKHTQAELAHKVNGKWKEREYMGGEFRNVNFLRVPPEHKDHSWFIRYEGPGWESDKVGYRFYLDQRNATDVFGKTVAEPVLQKVGLDGFDSYHELQDWGMDVMKVGKTLGVGSIGMLVDNQAVRVEVTDSLTSEILENGSEYSSILTNYYGWKTKSDTLDVTAKLSIHAGTRVTRYSLRLSHDSDQMCTGLGKDEKAKLYTVDPTETNFGYAATFGPQSLNNDNLGVAVLFSQSSFSGFGGDEFSHIVKLRSSDGALNYYFLAAWAGEPGGIKTEQEFIDYVTKVSKELASPVTVTVK